MLETLTLALTTGEWTAIGLLAALTLIGLLALSGSSRREDADEDEQTAAYVFGLGKNPHLIQLPELKQLPATPEPLGPEDLRRLGKKADATEGLATSRYQLPGGVHRPWELSADIPDSVEALEIRREEGGVVRVTRQGRITARPPLATHEREAVESIVSELVDDHALRADRRTWAHSAKSAEAINAKRV